MTTTATTASPARRRRANCAAPSQASITVPPEVNAKTRQKHDYPGPAFRLSYRRRTGVERSFSTLKNPATTDIRRGWCRLMGRAKNLVMFALATVVRNIRVLASFESRQADDARRAVTGRAPRTRRASSPSLARILR